VTILFNDEPPDDPLDIDPPVGIGVDFPTGTGT
jgi:hypothetical protein